MKQAWNLTRKVKTAIYDDWCQVNSHSLGFSKTGFLIHWQITPAQLDNIIQAAERAAKRTQPTLGASK